MTPDEQQKKRDAIDALARAHGIAEPDDRDRRDLQFALNSIGRRHQDTAKRQAQVERVKAANAAKAAAQINTRGQRYARSF